MKTTIAVFFIFLFSLGNAYAQFDFEPDTTGIPSMENTAGMLLGTPDFDSIQFEMRYWYASNWFPTFFIQLTLTTDSVWHYTSGTVDWQEKKLNLSEVQPVLPIAQLWDSLQKENVLHLPDQMDIDMKITSKKGRVITLTEDNKYRVFYGSTCGDFHTIELFSPAGYKRYTYYNPIDNVKHLKRKEWQWQEHENFSNIIKLLTKQFKHRALVLEEIRKRKN